MTNLYLWQGLRYIRVTYLVTAQHMMMQRAGWENWDYSGYRREDQGEILVHSAAT